MPTAFSDEEKKNIRKALLEAASHHVQTVGMKHTSLDELTRETGISKGAFYHFYESKELLFLNLMEEHCLELEKHLDEVEKKIQGLSPEKKSEELLREGLRYITNPSLSRFLYEDVPLLLRKLTQEKLDEHFATVDAFIGRLIHNAGIHIRVEESVAVAAIKMLVFCAAVYPHRDENSEQAIRVMTESLCKNLVCGA